MLQPRQQPDMFGFVSFYSEQRKPLTWDTRDEAERALQYMREQACEFGITDWCGVVVHQLCTPFTLHDPAQHFADEVQQWLDGGSQ
ncbi:hypothetical protein OS122_02665 [Mycolicibacterium mucogenicum]|uniref:hypothetical protein n=1 Tax=Mycolicibacterium mucogenicum TaxID=56689 RepID=UPI00226A5915|nr:hypothetical protein [Mycolicibacterium mucogenicum]MCX8559802.1 hypothetical protein [Mycolicibacterium mucogenicum]